MTVRQTWRKPLELTTSIPQQVEVLIIGGGIVGISTAWFLARQGISVAVCEKGHIAGEQSGRNWGWVRQQGRDERELPMMMESIRIWRGLRDEIGEDVGFTEGGCLYAAANEKELAKFDDWVKIARAHDLDTRVVGREQLEQLARGSAANWPGAMYTASDGRAEPHKATPALARAAERAGAAVLTACAVRGLDISAGRVTGAVTEHGLIKASKVLCAGGAWTSMFCRSVGVDLPQLKVRGTVVRTAPGPDLLRGTLFDTKIGIRRRQDGGYTIAPGSLLDHVITPSSFRHFRKFLPALRQELSSLRLSINKSFIDEWRAPATWDLANPSPFEAVRVLDPEPNQKAIRLLRRDLAVLFPALGELEFVETWAGMIESTPDIVPVIDETAIPGFYVATGFSGHGFGIGPGAGKAIAALLSDADPGVDLKPLRLSRFFDGSSIRPQSSI
mgnify:CR=1 FL=1